MEKKLSTSIEVLCKGCPPEFAKYLTYARSLRFDDKPDYQYCRDLFKERFEKENFVFDYEYDWNIIALEKKKDISTENKENFK